MGEIIYNYEDDVDFIVAKSLGLPIQDISNSPTHAIKSIDTNRELLGEILHIQGSYKFFGRHPYCSDSEPNWINRRNKPDYLPVRIISSIEDGKFHLYDKEIIVPFKTVGEYTGLVTFNGIDTKNNTIEKVPYIVSHPIKFIYRSQEGIPEDLGIKTTLYKNYIMDGADYLEYTKTNSTPPIAIVRRIARLSHRRLIKRGIQIPHIDGNPPFRIEDIPVDITTADDYLSKLILKFIDAKLSARRWWEKGIK